MGTALLLIVCTIAVFTVVVPFLLGAQSYTVLTGSMRPALEPGTLIAVRDTDPSDIRIGYVITFQLRSGEPEVATHRVAAVGIDGSGERVFTTRGDANDTDDRNAVRAAQIRGVLVYAVPWLGWLNLWVTPSVKSVLIGVIGGAAIAWGTLTLLRDRTGRRAASAASALAIIFTLSAAMVSPAAQAAEQAQFLLSADGVTYVPGPTIPLLDSSRLVVPGDEASARLWVRSSSDDPGILDVQAQWHPLDASDHRDAALASALTVRPVAPARLAAHGTAPIDLKLDLSAIAENDTRSGTATLLVTVNLRQDSDESALPRTGADASFPVIVGAVVLVAAGFTLVVVERSRGRRRN